MSNTANYEAALAVAAAAGVPDLDAPAPSSAAASSDAGGSGDAARHADADSHADGTGASGTPAATPAPKPRVDADTLERLRERQRAKRAKEPERREVDDPDYRAWKAAQQQSRGAGIDPDMLRRDPVRALEAAGVDVERTLNALTKHAVTPDTASLEARVDQQLEQLAEENKTLRSQIDQIREDRQARDRSKSTERARAAFQEHTSDAAKYPSLAKLSAERRAIRGARKAQELLDEGIEEFSMDEVAQLVESDLHGELVELLGRDPYESASSDAEAIAASTATQGRAKRSRTITPTDAGAAAAKGRTLTAAERYAAALEVAARS